MTLVRTTLLATLSLALLALTTTSADAASHQHIDNVALTMQSKARKLVSEFALHYRHKAGYRHLRADAIELYRVAAHIHLVVHQSGSLYHLRHDVQRADALFHHLEEVLARTDHSYSGHTHGDTHHVFELMHGLEQNLHHLKRDVESLNNVYGVVRSHRIRHYDGSGQRHGTGRRYHGSNRHTVQFGDFRWNISLGH